MIVLERLVQAAPQVERDVRELGGEAEGRGPSSPKPVAIPETAVRTQGFN